MDFTLLLAVIIGVNHSHHIYPSGVNAITIPKLEQVPKLIDIAWKNHQDASICGSNHESSYATSIKKLTTELINSKYLKENCQANDKKCECTIITKNSLLEYINTPKEFHFRKFRQYFPKIWESVCTNFVDVLLPDGEALVEEIGQGLEKNTCIMVNSLLENSRSGIGPFGYPDFMEVMEVLIADLNFLIRAAARLAGPSYIKSLISICDTDLNKTLDGTEVECFIREWFLNNLLRIND